MSRSSAAWWRQDNGKHPWVLKRRPLMTTEDEWDETGETWWNWYRVTIVMWTWSICPFWCLKLFWCACMLAEVRDVSVVWVVWLDLGNFTRVIRYTYIYMHIIVFYNYIHNYDHLFFDTFQDTLCCTILPPHRLAAIETARFMLIKEI